LAINFYSDALNAGRYCREKGVCPTARIYTRLPYVCLCVFQTRVTKQKKNLYER